MSCCSCNDTVGLRFYPSDKEIVDHYLSNKALGRDSAVQAIGEVDGDLCDWEPGELTRFSVQKSSDQVWYFFCRRINWKRVKRTTKLGYWKLTGKHRRVKAKVGIGIKKTLVFYHGRPKGERTPWVIHEYTLPDSLPNQKGIFLCKLKRKDEEEDGISRAEEGQPSYVAYDKISDDSAVINVDELLAELAEINGSDEVASAQKPQIYEKQGPSFNAASSLYDFIGVQNQSSTNEQDDELYFIPSTLQPHMHEEHVPSCNDSSHFCGSNGNFDEVQNQSSTNELDDEFWNNLFVDEDEAYLDETSNQLVAGDESSYLLVGINDLAKSSRKRPHIDDDGVTGVTETEVSRTRYDQALKTSSIFAHYANSNIFLEISLVEAPNVTLFAMDHNMHARERRLDIVKESRRGSAYALDYAADSNIVLEISLVEAPNVTLFAMGHNLHARERRLDILKEFKIGSASSLDYAADLFFYLFSRIFCCYKNIQASKTTKTSQWSSGRTYCQGNFYAVEISNGNVLSRQVYRYIEDDTTMVFSIRKIVLSNRT